VQRGTRGGRRRLKTVERCGRRCCNNRVNLWEGGGDTDGGLQNWEALVLVDQTFLSEVLQQMVEPKV